MHGLISGQGPGSGRSIRDHRIPVCTKSRQECMIFPYVFEGQVQAANRSTAGQLSRVWMRGCRGAAGSLLTGRALPCPWPYKQNPKQKESVAVYGMCVPPRTKEKAQYLYTAQYTSSFAAPAAPLVGGQSGHSEIYPERKQPPPPGAAELVQDKRTQMKRPHNVWRGTTSVHHQRPICALGPAITHALHK